MASTTLEIVIAARDQFSGTANKVIGSLNRMDSSAKRVGKGFTQLGAGLVRASAVGLAATATGLTFVAREAIKFEDAFAGVRKTVDEADLAAAGLTFDDLARSFRDMATEIPIAATEFARIGETAGALGIAAQDIDDFTRTVALMGVTTNLTTDAAAEGMGKLGTILGLTGDDFEELADSIVALGNKGASTEVEIVEMSKRFAAAGRQAGLAKEDIVALASAAASMGIEAEAGGGALSRLFSNIASDIALATDEGKAFAKITGRSLKQLTEDVREGRSLDIFTTFLEKLSKFDRIDAAKALKAAGITNVRDRDAVLKMAQNVGFLNDQLEISRTATGALGIEAQKRFDTIASKLQLLKNNALEAAITIGEGMLPAIGRATEKLTAFLQVPENKTALKELGEDIGDYIDGEDWDGLLRDARSFVGLLKDAATGAATLLGWISKLPNEVKAAGLGLIGLNKLSGGLVGDGLGNIAGGLGETLARAGGSKLPGIGKLFAQPVFVTNWPMGGLGGPGGGPSVVGGAGTAKTAGALGFAALAVTGAFLTKEQMEVQSSRIAAEVRATGEKFVSNNNLSTAQLTQAIAAVDTGIAQIKSNPLNVLVQGSALDELAATRASLQQQLDALERLKGAADRTKDDTVSALDYMANRSKDDAAQVRSKIETAEASRSIQAAIAIRAQERTISGVDRTSSKVDHARAGIVAAIRANRPIVNVDVSATTVVRTSVVQERAGRQSGSRGQGRTAS